MINSRLEVVVISLSDQTDRRRRIAEVLGQRDVAQWRFFDALRADSDAFGLKGDHDLQKLQYGRALGSSEIGCFKSHYSVLRDFVENGTTTWILVLEDDVWLDPHFDIDEVIAFAEARGLGFIRLFAKAYVSGKIIGRLSNFRQVVRFSSDPYGTQASLFSRQGARDFIESIGSINLPIDDELGRFWVHGLAPVAVFPFPAVEMSVPSNLDTERVSGAVDRDNLSVRRLVFRTLEKLRKIKANLRRI